MDAIFEGVRINHGTSNFYPTKPATAPTGTEFRSILKYGYAGYKTYQKEYQGQADDIIKGVFQNSTKKTTRYRPANPRNRQTEQNVVVGGVDHQHPHCDQGKVGSYNCERIYPFVAVHGFGVNEFQMWLLPCKLKREYGFLYKFPASAILFMRGDFIHAGACEQSARGHIHFFPLRDAGYSGENPYWAGSRFDTWMKDPEEFLLQDLRCIPFAYPTFSESNAVGTQMIGDLPCLLPRRFDSTLGKNEADQKRKRKTQVVAADTSADDTDPDSNDKTDETTGLI
jgi:hypothetical protein